MIIQAPREGGAAGEPHRGPWESKVAMNLKFKIGMGNYSQSLYCYNFIQRLQSWESEVGAGGFVPPGFWNF